MSWKIGKEVFFVLNNIIIKRKVSAIFTAAAMMLAPCSSLSAIALDEVRTAVPETQLFDADGGTAKQKDTCVLTLSPEVDSVTPGGTVTVNIMLDSNPGINGLVFDVVFDTNVLELRRKWKDKNFFEESPHEVMYNEINDGDVRFLWASATLVDNNGNDVVFYDEGKLGYLVFNVKDTAALGSTTISVVRDSMKAVRSLGTNEKRYNNVDVPSVVNECSVDIVDSKTISEVKVGLEQSKFVYTGKPHTPAVTVADKSKTLKEGVDYTVSYKNNVNAGTASVILTGMGDYSGSVTKTFEIKPKNLSDVVVKLSSRKFDYDGTAKTPKVAVTDDEKKLALNTDFKVSFSNNVDAGTAGVTVVGIGNYTGSVTKTFEINPRNLSDMIVKLSSRRFDYDGTAKTPKVMVTDAAKKLVLNTDFTVSYSNNIDVGTAWVTVIGTGNYTGEIKLEFRIKNIPTGSLNNDDKVDVDDLVLMQQVVAGWKVGVDPILADVDGNGETDINDLILMQQMIAGWKVKFA